MTDTRRPAGGQGAASGAATRLSKDDRLAELEARLARLERAPSLRARGRTVMDKVMPAEASEHFRNAGREQLLGVRSIVDFWIQRLDEADSRAAGRSRERETIEID
ncbi:MAG TPA: hypothetical protein VFP66_05710 [Candidatus Limnocylindrales bacterium]|nr:hypothetical protein [Candidatus Limnocylindrales bacterium]